MIATYWYLGSDQVVWVKGLENAITELAINDATVTGQLCDKDLVPVGAKIVFVPTGANGNYWGVKPAGLVLVKGTEYKLKVLVVSGDYQRTVYLNRRAEYDEI